MIRFRFSFKKLVELWRMKVQREFRDEETSCQAVGIVSGKSADGLTLGSSNKDKKEMDLRGEKDRKEAWKNLAMMIGEWTRL